MKFLSYIYRGLIAVISLTLAGLSVNAMLDQSRTHQAGVFGSNEVAANPHLALIALVLALFALGLCGLATFWWKYLKSPLSKTLLIFIAVAAYLPFWTGLALQ